MSLSLSAARGTLHIKKSRESIRLAVCDRAECKTSHPLPNGYLQTVGLYSKPGPGASCSATMPLSTIVLGVQRLATPVGLDWRRHRSITVQR